MKKLLLTTLILITVLQGFGQSKELGIFIKKTISIMQQGDTISCLKTIDSALHTQYNDTLAMMLLQTSIYADEVHTYVHSMESFYDTQKSNAVYMVLLGEGYRMDMEYEKAVNCFEIALNDLNYKGDDMFNPQNTFFYNELAYCYLRLGKYKNALRSAQTCVELNPKEFFHQITLANVHNAMGKPDKAIKVLDYISSDTFNRSMIGKNNIEASYAYAYYLKKDYSKAIEYYIKSSEKYPQRWNNLYFLAECYRKTGNTDKACEYYKKCVEIANSTLTEKIILHKDVHHFKVQFKRTKDAQKQIEKLNCQ